ncbi:hypothetical protein [Spartinivicinus ruber]|uniref:hypothetical protein n=1 Tax=Spartinivicinus ruber TaxID=2683272 RepID=UPI0013CF4958|nr:hypothetical protein [Spartinivicinus ruber]
MKKQLAALITFFTLFSTSLSYADVKITADKTNFSDSDCSTQYTGNVELRTKRIKQITSKNSKRLDKDNIRFTNNVKIELDNAVITTENATYTTLDNSILITMDLATISNSYGCKNIQK